MPGEDEDSFPVLSDRHNIVVIADEAHRTQYGFEAKLKVQKAQSKGTCSTNAIALAMPVLRKDGDAAAVGDSGCSPVQLPGRLRPASARCAAQRHLCRLHRHTRVSEDRDTRAVFGDYIHVYDMQQAKEDGATVAIYYESRLAKLGLKDD